MLNFTVDASADRCVVLELDDKADAALVRPARSVNRQT